MAGLPTTDAAEIRKLYAFSRASTFTGRWDPEKGRWGWPGASVPPPARVGPEPAPACVRPPLAVRRKRVGLNHGHSRSPRRANSSVPGRDPPMRENRRAEAVQNVEPGAGKDATNGAIYAEKMILRRSPQFSGQTDPREGCRSARRREVVNVSAVGFWRLDRLGLPADRSTIFGC
jgi:hypothetical protein